MARELDVWELIREFVADNKSFSDGRSMLAGNISPFNAELIMGRP